MMLCNITGFGWNTYLHFFDWAQSDSLSVINNFKKPKLIIIIIINLSTNYCLCLKLYWVGPASITASQANCPGNTRRTIVWISWHLMLRLLLYLGNQFASFVSLSTMIFFWHYEIYLHFYITLTPFPSTSTLNSNEE